jgi:two-component system C4-dicarboxylate transport response regulator DctD
VVDLTMPNLTGRAVVEGIRALEAPVPILLMSGHSDHAQWTIELGTNGFLAKPYTVAQSIGELERVLASIEV